MRIRGLTSFFRSVVALLSCIGTRALKCQVYVKKQFVSCSASAAIPSSVRPFGSLKYLECPSRSADCRTLIPAAQLLTTAGRFCASLVKPILRLGNPPLFCFAALSSPNSQLTYQAAPPPCSGTVNSPASQRIPPRTTFFLIQPG